MEQCDMGGENNKNMSGVGGEGNHHQHEGFNVEKNCFMQSEKEKGGEVVKAVSYQ